MVVRRQAIPASRTDNLNPIFAKHREHEFAMLVSGGSNAVPGLTKRTRVAHRLPPVRRRPVAWDSDPLEDYVVVGDSNAVGWGYPPGEESFARLRGCEVDGHPGNGVAYPDTIVASQAVRRAVRAPRHDRDRVRDATSSGNRRPVAHVARALTRRYRQACRAGARVLVVPLLAQADGDGPLATAIRTRNAELTALLPVHIPVDDVVDVSTIGAGEHATRSISLPPVTGYARTRSASRSTDLARG